MSDALNLPSVKSTDLSTWRLQGKKRERLSHVLRRISDLNAEMHAQHNELNRIVAGIYGFEVREIQAEEIIKFLLGEGSISVQKFDEIMMKAVLEEQNDSENADNNRLL